MTENDLYSHLMYPQVFADFETFLKEYDRLTGLPTTSFFYGLSIGEEISVEIDPGKILFIRLIGIGEADVEGNRTVFYELNGMPREARVLDKALAPKDVVVMRKGDPNDPSHVIAPIPGMVSEINVSVGAQVDAGEPVLSLEAMKMLTTVSAGAAGKVSEVLVSVGDTVESNDLVAVIDLE